MTMVPAPALASPPHRRNDGSRVPTAAQRPGLAPVADLAARRAAARPAVSASPWLSYAVSDAAVAGVLRAEDHLARAASLTDPVARFAAAHVAALQAGGAILAIVGRPTRGKGTLNVWVALRAKAPGLAAWADRFAATGRQRAKIEAGIRVPVTAAEADALVDDVAAFLGLAETWVTAA